MHLRLCRQINVELLICIKGCIADDDIMIICGKTPSV